MQTLSPIPRQPKDLPMNTIHQPPKPERTTSLVTMSVSPKVRKIFKQAALIQDKQIAAIAEEAAELYAKHKGIEIPQLRTAEEPPDQAA